VRRRGFLGLAIAAGIAASTEGCVTITPVTTIGDYPVATGVDLASPTFQAMRQRNSTGGQIVIGIKVDQPGIGYLDGKGVYSGFDVEIAKLVSAGLGFRTDQIQFQTVNSLNRESAIEDNTVDLVIASYSYSQERTRLVSFAGPYLKTTQGLLVGRNSRVTALSSLTAGTSVCSATGSTSALALNNVAKKDTYATYSECVQALELGKVDAVYTDVAILAGFAARDPAKLKVIDSGTKVQLYGIGLRSGDTTLTSKINSLLVEAERDGVWARIFKSTLSNSGITGTAPQVGDWQAV
jgi:glutamate transport system substrate-binding protein